MRTKQQFFQNYYKYEEERPLQPPCAETNCPQPGAHKAPKDRHGNYYQFCLDHVKAYNTRWNYYAGMDENRVDAELRADTGWRRPTWPLNASRFRPQHFTIHDPLDMDITSVQDVKNPTLHPDLDKALKVLNVSWPMDLIELKKHYKTLVKKYHPDTNQQDPSAEGKLKDINLAYQVIKSFLG
jgi:DnaJ-domain-containing protein 1